MSLSNTHSPISSSSMPPQVRNDEMINALFNQLRHPALQHVQEPLVPPLGSTCADLSLPEPSFRKLLNPLIDVKHYPPCWPDSVYPDIQKSLLSNQSSISNLLGSRHLLRR
jgi:hypothetical protein